MMQVWLEGMMEWGKLFAAVWYIRARDVVLKCLGMVAIFTVLLWISMFLYGSFYYSYMPALSHIREINLQFSTECNHGNSDLKGLCSFPFANFSLVQDTHAEILMRGQPYKIYLDLEMPESPVNQQLGMFMVQIKFYSWRGQVVKSTSRSAMLTYKSGLLQTMETLAFSPMLVLGFRQQKQLQTVQLYSNYLEDSYKPAIGALVEVQTRQIEIYSSKLRIHAHFTGLRYLLFNYPVLSFICGVGTNLLFMATIVFLSWYRLLAQPKLQDGQMVGKPGTPRRMTLEQRRNMIKAQMQKNTLKYQQVAPQPTVASVQPVTKAMLDSKGSPEELKAELAEGPDLKDRNISDSGEWVDVQESAASTDMDQTSVMTTAGPSLQTDLQKETVNLVRQRHPHLE